MSVRSVRAKPERIVLVCGKCAKRNGHRDRLSKPLKHALKPLGTKVIVTKCLGVCPGRATALHDSASPREWLLVKDGTEIGEVVAMVSRAASQTD